MTRVLVALMSLLILGGCTAVRVGAPAVRASARCVPPGSPPFETWRPVGGDLTITDDETGRPRLVIRRAYRAGALAILTYWADGLLIAVDLAPHDAEAPPWVDRGAVSGPNLRLRVDAHTACAWERHPGWPAGPPRYGA